jgi:cellulose synthase/poly-beta-1,6-N-acetylglucosamine synthase-like glycosyltransferase
LLVQSLAPAEILVIDDGSADNSAEIAGRYPSVTLVRHERNSGLAAARNTAFRCARSEFVASLDADCFADREWLAKLVPHLAEPEVAGVGGSLAEGVQASLADRWRQAHMAQQWGSGSLRNPKFIFGCNNVFRKSAVLSVGGYDESMRNNGEDCDLSRRLRARNWQLIYDPGARATHLRSDTTGTMLDLLALLEVWCQRLFQRNLPTVCRRPRAVCSLRFVSSSTKARYRSTTIRTSAARFCAGLARVLVWQHALARRFSLLLLDAATAFVHSYHDDVLYVYPVNYYPASPTELHNL